MHATTDRELAEFYRIRLTYDGTHVSVTASDRFTVALAIVSVWESSADAGLVVELLPDDVAKMLSIFKVTGKELGETPEYTVRFDVGDEHVTVTDCSGMIDGRALRVPRLATDEALDIVPGIVHRAHFAQQALLVDMTVSGDSLARFKVAGKAYGEPVAIEARGKRTLLIRCGESFLGVMTPRRVSEDDVLKAKEWAEGWAARLPEIVDTAEASRTA
ncbi:hypothetical protein IU501_22955 [Nocardia otitidiscaviarum]|uniref:hypothetical protein n=1 Tax=Nocardia otitidiscaviarum TaxID=1823 RepID=UPI0018947BFA|nr:hypothetical protein [Nocardia otitidiscaviarum]MBF6135854.1 hypothetical protein [Nocardia otitidiscaviarum]